MTKCLPCLVHYGPTLKEQILPLIINLSHGRALLEFLPDGLERDQLMDKLFQEWDDDLQKTDCERIVNLEERSDAAEWAREFKSGTYEMFVDGSDIYMRTVK